MNQEPEDDAFEDEYVEEEIDLSSPDVRRAAALIAIRECWRRGDLNYKRHATQKKISAALDKATTRSFFFLCSRRLGKSFEMNLRALETALRTPNARILYLAPWARDAADISGDIMATILEDCPPEFRPDYSAQAKEYRFKNGSLIRYKGTNGEHARYLRGGAADLILLDEVADMDDLDNVVGSVCLPMLMTKEHGRMILATTPAMSPGHESAKIYERLASEGSAVVFTIRDAPHVSDKVKAEFLREAGEAKEDCFDIIRGRKDPKTTKAQREYFCQWVTDASRAVVPEFTTDLQRQIVVPHTRPASFDAYVAMDPGFEDRTGIIFAYYDFLNAKLVIEDELLLHRARTQEIADAIGEKEWSLWGSEEPYKRVSDVDKRLLSDLRTEHRLIFTQAAKQDSLGAVNLLRNQIARGDILIDPRCTNLIRQLQNATWNNKASDFARAGEASMDGHYDLVAALKYLVRAVDWKRRPGGFALPRHATGPNQFRSPRAAGRRVSADPLGVYSRTPAGRKIANRRKP